MKIDKISVVLLAGITVCLALAFMLPATVPAMAGNVANQTATTGQATTIEVKAWNNITVVTGWTFSGIPGGTNETPVNSNNENQTPSTIGKPVAVLNNTGTATYKIRLNAASFSPADVVANEYYNVTNITEAPSGAEISSLFTFGADMDTGKTIEGSNGIRHLWLKVTFGGTANTSATSQFSVVGEMP